MNAWRAGFAIVTAIAALFALASIAIHHSGLYLPFALAAAALCSLLLGERGRYVAPIGQVGGRGKATSELFFDPVTGERMQVYCDPTTGIREYRPIA